MDKQHDICEYLRKYHTGQERAVYSRELQRLFRVDGRALRRTIHRLRQEGFPICSGQSGYYYAQSRDEITDTVRRLNKTAIRISRTCASLRRFDAAGPQPLVCIEIWIEGNGSP